MVFSQNAPRAASFKAGEKEERRIAWLRLRQEWRLHTRCHWKPGLSRPRVPVRRERLVRGIPSALGTPRT
ncbi:hypothetical protein FX983_05490 [Pseudomonas frederiksbergensis]|uniref:Uncharacterized protein n=1 Tax=Pseudomonas frederiksbergensis TaxID=104087 RepID=A0A6L5BV60_9PSED|nr:hypothetical protein FX983_05490 [Pseudomonas frederiksbergensis]